MRSKRRENWYSVAGCLRVMIWKGNKSPTYSIDRKDQVEKPGLFAYQNKGKITTCPEESLPASGN